MQLVLGDFIFDNIDKIVFKTNKHKTVTPSKTSLNKSLTNFFKNPVTRSLIFETPGLESCFFLIKTSSFEGVFCFLASQIPLYCKTICQNGS